MNFCSDNVTGASPEILAALSAANGGALASYGSDKLTERVEFIHAQTSTDAIADQRFTKLLTYLKESKFGRLKPSNGS